GERRLAAAALAIEHDMRALFLDRGNDALHLLEAAGEEPRRLLRPRRREGVAQQRAELARFRRRGARAHPGGAGRGERERRRLARLAAAALRAARRRRLRLDRRFRL